MSKAEKALAERATAVVGVDEAERESAAWLMKICDWPLSSNPRVREFEKAQQLMYVDVYGIEPPPDVAERMKRWRKQGIKAATDADEIACRILEAMGLAGDAIAQPT